MNSDQGEVLNSGRLVEQHLTGPDEPTWQPEDASLARLIDEVLHRPDGGLSIDLLYWLTGQASFLHQICNHVQSGRVQLKSLAKVLSNIKLGAESTATEEMIVLRDKGYKTLLTWANGQSLQKLPNSTPPIFSGIAFVEQAGTSIRPMSGGLPGLGRKK